MSEEYLLSVIANIEEQHHQQHLMLTYAMKQEIMARIYEDMRNVLGILMANDKIDYHKTLNSWGVELKKE